MNHRGSSRFGSDGETARIVVEFLEVAINTIVFLKGVYPSGTFERCRYMNVVVEKSRHPQLRDYIHSTVQNLQPFIQKGLVERVAVIFFDKENVPSERFLFKFTLSSSSAEEGSLESCLRSFLVKLLVSEPLTKVISSDCRWEIVGYFSTLPQEAVGNEEAKLWTSTNTKQWQQPPLITPIKSMSSESANMQLYLEHPSLSECGNQPTFSSSPDENMVIQDTPDR
ncbi:hypothetical protein MKW94_028518 [Papaver nudicaule]|uniref:HORMA domain-containing protein n=1 Tax=Papaver nudicaule TaxID=74823 RepID=A0AA41RM98_PAPNU|nr:hypothetical protein [Papaver nudicaule]